MGRNTEFEKIDFPVSLKPVYLKGKKYSELTKYKAVTGIADSKETIFSLVSNNYSLITNSEALELGKNIFKEFFPSIDGSKFEIFNINYPNTRSFCHIDIINDCYSFNIWEKEVFIPFIRITNSYNKTRSLKFEIGFSRKVCDNGVIFEKETVELNYAHYKKSVSGILENIKAENQYDKLKKLEDEFSTFMKSLKELKINKEYYTPLTAKIFQLKFDIKSESRKIREKESKKMNQFVDYCEILSKNYISEIGENAYSLFNVATAFANNRDFVKSYRYNDYQIKAGTWLKTFTKRDQGESLEDYLKDYKYLTNKN